jgi:hypothetical protein
MYSLYNNNMRCIAFRYCLRIQSSLNEARCPAELQWMAHHQYKLRKCLRFIATTDYCDHTKHSMNDQVACDRACLMPNKLRKQSHPRNFGSTHDYGTLRMSRFSTLFFVEFLRIYVSTNIQI